MLKLKTLKNTVKILKKSVQVIKKLTNTVCMDSVRILYQLSNFFGYL